MNYWHMQLHPNEQDWGREVDLLKNRGLIGLGDYKELNNQEKLFMDDMEKGDIVLIKNGDTRIALVQVDSDYFHESKTDDLAWFNKRRKVKILDILEKPKNDFPASRQALQKLKTKTKPSYKIIDNWYKAIMKEQSMLEKINLLNNRKQIILQGPPGTGKTRVAKQIAIKMINSTLPLETNEDIKNSLAEIEKDRIKLIQFHPSYSYEDFVRGIVATATDDGKSVKYETKDKVLAQMAKKALEDKEKNYILIIDEINRANLSSVLGELIYALEYRNEAVESMYELDGGSREITLPSNLYIIGTMNTADRSVGHIDYAIRRRFAFESVLPSKGIIDLKEGKTLFDEVEKLFKKNNAEKADTLSIEFDPDDVMLGHSYFMAEDEDKLKEKLEYQIKPLLREYLKDGVLTSEAKTKIHSLSI